MRTFIDEVVKTVNTKYGNSLRNTCIVFPTRRACLIFRQRLAESFSKPEWAPGILSIGDFINRHSAFPVTEEIPLLVSLFDVYKKYWPEQDFGKYYAWGQMLLNDFDEIDKQLSDPSRVLASISEIKKIDASFLPDSESLQWIREFIKSFDEKKITELQTSFTKTWNRLQSIYHEYNLMLDQKEMAYEGKAYRLINHKLRTGKLKSDWNQYLFAGFYGFSRAEEAMIRNLSSLAEVELIWDDDPYYVQNKNHEAGYYFRKSQLYSAESATSHFSDETREIEITGIPLRVGQAKYAGQLIANLVTTPGFNIHTTAIVLPDENMLFPVLYSIPASVEAVNVTMGYPLRNSQYDELLRVLYELHRTPLFNENGEREFLHRHVIRLLRLPIFRDTVREVRDTTITGSAKLTTTEIQNMHGIKSAEIVFANAGNPASIFSYLEDLLIYLKNSLASKNGITAPLDFKILDYIITELHKLKQQLESHFSVLTPEISWQMIRECITGLKVPFSGEPVKGIQVMGFLETRALDFETIILLDVNEGILPPAGSGKSFIPFSLRKAYGLSTYEDQEASAGYHFYRLLHRSQRVFLLYNSEVNKTNGGEAGRYLLQLKQELGKTFPETVIIRENLVQTPVIPEVLPGIWIEKDADVREKLAAYLEPGNTGTARYFSSSAITSYIECSLRFYYRYVADLRIPDEKETSIEANVFGSILHRTLQLLYSGVVNPVTTDQIDSIIDKIDEQTGIAIAEIFGTPAHRLEGEDILLAGVIRELVKRILIADRKDTPFSIKGMEEKLTGTIETTTGDVNLMGIIDRFDEKDAVDRIIDYKTGNVEIKKTDIEKLFTDPKRKPIFQLYFYALLHNLNFGNKPVRTGFYIARSLGKGVSWIENGAPVSEENILNFRTLLKGILDEIMNPEIPFSQTSDIKRCEFCDYKIICNR